MRSIFKDNILEIDNAYLYPARKDDFGGGKQGKVLFGVHDNELSQSKDFFNHIRLNKIWEDDISRKECLATQTPTAVKGVWLYGGPLFEHFGHFMSESIHRLWAFSFFKDRIQGIRFHAPIHWHGKKSRIPKYMLEVFSLFSITLDDIELVGNLEQVEKLILPRPGSGIGNYKQKWYLDNLDYLFKSILDKLDNKEIYSNKTHFSRRNYLLKGRLLGMEYIEREMKNAMVKVIYPEELSLVEQLSLLMYSDNIVFEEGSAIHLLELLPKSDRSILLIKRRPGQSYLDDFISLKSNSVCIYSDVDNYYFDGLEAPRYNLPSIMQSPEKLHRILYERGLVTSDFDLDLYKIFKRADIYTLAVHKKAIKNMRKL